MFITIVFIIIVLILFAVILLRRNNEEQATDTPVQYSPEYLAQLAEVKRQAEENGDDDTVNAVLNMTYDGPMPIKKEDGTYSSIYARYIRYNIAGINFRRGIANYVGKSRGYIKPEPKNSHDPNAIAIYCEDGHHLGYIPMDETDDVRDLGKEFPISVFIEIEEDFDYDENRKYYRGEIMIEL